MIVRYGEAIPFSAFYTTNGVSTAGLTVTVDVRNPAGTEVVTGGSATSIGDGIYTYSMSSSLNTAEGDYHAIFKTSDGSVDQQHLADRKTSQKTTLTVTDGIETGYTLQAAMRLVLAVLCGKVSGAEANLLAFRDVGDTADRVTATCDDLGNRTAVTLVIT